MNTSIAYGILGAGGVVTVGAFFTLGNIVASLISYIIFIAVTAYFIHTIYIDTIETIKYSAAWPYTLIMFLREGKLPGVPEKFCSRCSGYMKGSN